jgi:hypothetical protein
VQWGNGSFLRMKSIVNAFGRAAIWKITVFCLVRPCNSERSRSFGGTYSLLLHGRNVSQARNLSHASVSFLLGLIFYLKSESIFTIL